ncbi:hypothetical protein OSTOST_06816, partial [Ostertagia ostertagi]
MPHIRNGLRAYFPQSGSNSERINNKPESPGDHGSDRSAVDDELIANVVISIDKMGTLKEDAISMSLTDLHIEKQYSFCGLSLRCATQVCTAAQAVFCFVLGIFYRILLEPSVIVSILFGIHMFCTVLSLTFLVFCFLKRKFGTFYGGLLHAYLLSILLMALTSLFAVMFLPLAFLQQSHSFGE